MQNINTYDKELFKEKFLETEVYNKLRRDYNEDELSWDKFFVTNNHKKCKSVGSAKKTGTPRDMFSEHFSASVFYYLLPLLEQPYEKIYDIGCGRNMFKPYIDRLTGIGAEEAAVVHCYTGIKDPSWPNISNINEYKSLPDWIKKECEEQHGLKYDSNIFYGDEHGFVDKNYVIQHQSFFERAFSICALHFHPVNCLKQVVEDFVSLIKPGGRAFLSLNLQKMLDFSEPEMLIDLFGAPGPTRQSLDQYVRQQLDDIETNWLIVDIDLTVIGDGLDGNIRLVFDK